jgi:hypothetical protein
MEAKYYTPEFHEFHEGFEYQDNFFSTSYFPKTFSFFEVQSPVDRRLFIKAIDNKQIRVKYLDREDIESLGFKYDCDNFYNGLIYTILLVNGNVWIYFKQNIGNETIVDKTLFFGKIKNKSELKRVMKQTGILSKVIKKEDGKVWFETPKGKVYLDIEEYNKSIDWENKNLGK